MLLLKSCTQYARKYGKLRVVKGLEKVSFHFKSKEKQYKRMFKSSSVAQSCPTVCNPMNHSMSSLLVHHQLPEVTQTHVHRVRDEIKPSHPLSPFLLLPTIPCSIRVFSNESTLCMRWPKYWSFSFSIIPSKEIPELISFRMYWLDLLAVQRTRKSSPKPQFKKHQFFAAQLSSQSNSRIHT